MLCFVDVQGCQDSKLQAERIATLQERKRALEALLNSRVGELKQVCLQEAVSSSHFSYEPYMTAYNACITDLIYAYCAFCMVLYK